MFLIWLRAGLNNMLVSALIWARWNCGCKQGCEVCVDVDEVTPVGEESVWKANLSYERNGLVVLGMPFEKSAFVQAHATDN